MRLRTDDRTEFLYFLHDGCRCATMGGPIGHCSCRPMASQWLILSGHRPLVGAGRWSASACAACAPLDPNSRRPSGSHRRLLGVPSDAGAGGQSPVARPRLPAASTNTTISGRWEGCTSHWRWRSGKRPADDFFRPARDLKVRAVFRCGKARFGVLRFAAGWRRLIGRSLHVALAFAAGARWFRQPGGASQAAPVAGLDQKAFRSALGGGRRSSVRLVSL